MRVESLYDVLASFPDIDGYWNPRDLVLTEQEIRLRLPQDPETNWNSSTIELLTQLARVQGLQNNLPAAKATLEQVTRAIAEKNIKIEPRAELRLLLEQGRLLCLAMTPSRAQDVFAQAWSLAEKTGETYFMIDAALMLSTIRPPKSQNEWLQQALQLAEKSPDPKARLWLSQIFISEGWRAFDGHQYDRALASFEKALALPLMNDDENLGFALQWSKARALRALAKYEESIAIQESLQKQMESKGKVNGHVYLEIAEIQQLLQDTEGAKLSFEKAHTELSTDPWYADNRGAELNRMKHIYKKR